MASPLSKLKQPSKLLNHILDNPELPAIIQRLDAGVLTRLIRHVGLEDSAEIISMATVDQLKQVFDEDLWQNKSPGKGETFDAERFGLWVQMMLETSPEFAAQRLRELDEDLVTLGLCQLVLVMDMAELTLRMSDHWRSSEDDIVDKVLDSTLYLELDSYLVIARKEFHWDAIQILLTELNEIDHALLERLLERCCRISADYIEESGGILEVLSEEDMLEEDMAAEREARREESGYVSAVSAAFFLNTVRTTSLKKLISESHLDAATRNYFRAMEEKTAAPQPSQTASETSGKTAEDQTDIKVANFLNTLREADVLPPQDQKLLGDSGESVGHHLPLVKAMGKINHTDPELYFRQLRELTYLSNILMSGCAFNRRPFRPVEAAEAAFSICNLGGEYLLGVRPEKGEERIVLSMTSLLAEHHLVKLFQLGWKILYDVVVLFSAKALAEFFDRIFKEEISTPLETKEILHLAGTLQAAVTSGKPWTFITHLDQLQTVLDGDTINTLTALMQELPTMPGSIKSIDPRQISPFIWSHTQIKSIRQALKNAFQVLS